MRLFIVAALAALSLAGCVPQGASPPIGAGHPTPIIVREFAFSPGNVTLDPSFGFSLYRGAPGVPPRQRAETVARGAAFTLADTVAQQLASQGYDAVRDAAAAPDPGGRALVVTGAFRRIYEGHRRQGASVAVDAEIDFQPAGGAPSRVASLSLDSRQLPEAGMIGVSARRGHDVNLAATRVGAALARYVAELARRNNWPAASR